MFKYLLVLIDPLPPLDFGTKDYVKQIINLVWPKGYTIDNPEQLFNRPISEIIKDFRTLIGKE